MSIYRDVAHDGGYRGDEAEQVARMLEEQHRQESELDLCPMGCGRTTDDPDGGHACLAGMPWTIAVKGDQHG
jgi:hypothetical protein